MPPKRSEDQPSRNEDEFFAKQDAELLKEMRAKLDAERAQQERKAHFMKCPKCGADLAEQARGDVHVDVCPDCGGMWLDAGELELLKQVDRSSKTGLRGIFDLLPNRSSKSK
ncbi:MAG: zf-TFIIB domain-containing protein [Gemmatimonadaceae bacterium]